MRLRRRPEPVAEVEAAVPDSEWWATIKRDGFRCRVSPFLPDLACDGDLDAYTPSPGADAVTVCAAHLAWMDGNRDAAVALGLRSPV